MKAIRSADTVVDTDANGTTRRATAWLTPQFAAQVRQFPPVAAPGAVWNSWAAHRARITVTTRLAGDEHPADTATTASRQVIAVQTPLGRDGWHGPVQTKVVFVSLARTPAGWRIAAEQSN